MYFSYHKTLNWIDKKFKYKNQYIFKSFGIYSYVNVFLGVEEHYHRMEDLLNFSNNF
jgi:hypothetical protein